jgi:anti-sigma B factor antagonist
MIGLDVERLDSVPLARPRGDIDAANARQVRDELIDCLALGADDVVLDLSTTRYLDSAGIDMLLRLGERLRERRARLLVVIARDSPLARLAQIVGLPGALPVHDTLEQALDACSPRIDR